jgi:hypothetical protein
MLMENLIKQQLISPGTWIGVHNSAGMVVKRLLVNRVIDHNQLAVIDASTNHVVMLASSMIKEIDGMSLHRFCEQAGLDSDGEPLAGARRRGRRPKSQIGNP